MKLQKAFQDALQAIVSPAKTAFIGLGNPDRGDDLFGLEMAVRLRDMGIPHVFSEYDNIDEIILDLRENQQIQTVLFIDVVDVGAQPGTPILLCSDQFPPLRQSHSVPLDIYAAVLEARQKRVYCLGVQPGTLDFQKPLSDCVSKTLDELLSFFRILYGN
ncbi:MAG: hydrogenase maturation protease [Candidatus Ranarchaeia archaeon]